MNIKKDSIYFLLFMPFSLIIAALENFIYIFKNEMTFINAISQISISLFFFYEKYKLKLSIQNKKERDIYFKTKKRNHLIHQN